MKDARQQQQLQQLKKRIPLRRNEPVHTMSFRCTVGLFTSAAVCAVTSAFSLHPYTFRRGLHSHGYSSHHSIFSVLPQRTVLLQATTDEASLAQTDDAEWKALVSAFQMYKAAYGDLKVPSRFIVPSLPPWPEKAWGMKLGQKVSAIRATGKHVQDNEKRRKVLDGLGFMWRLRTTASPESEMDGVTFEQIYEALIVYRREFPTGGELQIPPSFVVPNCDPWPLLSRGLPLGKTIDSMRSKSFLKANPGAAEKLTKIGLTLDNKSAANDTRFESVFEALKRYKEIYGDLLVPQPFVVPENSKDWPKNTWGLRLGARVNAIRSQGTFVNTNPERRQELDSIGFVWSPPASARGKKRVRRTKAELEADRLAEESEPTILPVDEFDFSIDEESDWEDTGAAMDNIFGPSFDFGSDDPFKNDNGTPSWGMDGEDMTPNSIKVQAEPTPPSEDEYIPPMTLDESLALARANAIAVGVILDHTADSLIKKGRQVMDIPWYNDDFGEDFVFEDVVEALTVYKKMYGDFTNLTTQGCSFEIPGPEADVFGEEDSSMFDTEASARAAAAIAAFEEEGNIRESEDLIAFEINRLQQEVQSPASMQSTAVASRKKLTAKANVVWPEHLSGMPLGGITRRIRDGSLEVKHIAERKKMLDKIDFDWGDDCYFLEIPFEKAMCSFFAYYLIRGDMFVYDDFVMPDEDPWPEALAGYEIGKAVKRIRELQYFMEAYHPEKVRLLRGIDFVWFQSLALPLDPDKVELTMEQMYLIQYGHPNIYKLFPIPEGLLERLRADGPFYETDDPIEEWRKYYKYEYVKDYWYKKGFRDIPFRLRIEGFPRCAAEHEAQYGPGLYEQIDTLFAELKEKGAVSGKKKKEDVLNKLKFFRSELIGSRDLSRDKLLALIAKIEDTMAKLKIEDAADSSAFAASGFGAAIGGVEEEEVLEDSFDFEEEDVVADDDVDLSSEFDFADDEESPYFD